MFILENHFLFICQNYFTLILLCCQHICGYEYINSILSRVQNIVNNYPENKTHAFGRRGKILWKYSIEKYRNRLGENMTIQIIVFIKDSFPSVGGKPFKFIFDSKF